MSRSIILAAFVALAAASTSVQAQERPAEAAKPAKVVVPGMINCTLPTMGGVQYWSDELVRSNWRIQRNCFTGHCRLLDASDWRRAWGSYDDCRAAMDKLHAAEHVAPLHGRVVLLVHGLAGCRPMMESLCAYLKKEGKLQAVSVAYPSTRMDVDAEAAVIGRIVAGLAEADQIDIVAHSLGNIVVRRYLAMNTDPATGKKPDPRINRIVMLAPPNHGAIEAKRLVAIDVTGQVAGPAARQLTSKWSELEPKLATPACEFGILAGGHGDGQGYNPLLVGDDDGVVTVESAKLAGARDFRVVPVLHILFMRQLKVQEYTLRFLQDGCFETEAKRTPL